MLHIKPPFHPRLTFGSTAFQEPDILRRKLGQLLESASQENQPPFTAHNYPAQVFKAGLPNCTLLYLEAVNAFLGIQVLPGMYLSM